MSLTSELNQNDSFTRRFIDEHFPHLKDISRECNRRIRGLGLEKLAPIHKYKVVSMLVGTAIDFRVRAYFNRHIEETGAVVRGLTILRRVKELEKPWVYPEGHPQFWADNGYWIEELEVFENAWYARRGKRVAERFLSSYRNFAAKAKPERRQLASHVEEQLCRYCILFAYLDWIGRLSGNSCLEMMIRLGSPNVGRMLSAVDSDIVTDLMQLSARFYEQQRELLRSFKKVAVGGPFAGSRDVGGADFDLIVDRCLIDLKTLLRPGISTMHLRQLVGYWLLDYEDALNIASASIVLVRHAHMQRFKIRDLIGSDIDVPEVRSRFRKGCRDHARNYGMLLQH